MVKTLKTCGFLLTLLILIVGCNSPEKTALPNKTALTLAKNGRTDYVIVISREASPSEQHAAGELQKFLEEMSGVKIAVSTDESELRPAEIILGDNDHLKKLNLPIDWPKLGPEGFTIRTAGHHLVIAGGRLRGTMYGVYTFLEDYLDCRWFSSKVSRIPKHQTIKISEINDTQIPVFEYREDFYFDAFDADWAARNKMNSSRAGLEQKHGGKIVFEPDLGHTFYRFLPPEEYFEKHPEYYSEHNGQRFYQNGQLCLTNPEVVKLVTDKIKKLIAEKPQVNIIPVSQNDWGGWCECRNCRALDEQEGSHSGTIINFVNQIAEALEKDYPDKAIDTFAYQYSRRPPKTVKPRHNVIVRLCSIECCFAHPLDGCLNNIYFVEDLKGWAKICRRLYVWDYVTNFANYIMPFPNFDSLGPNLKLFAAHNVKGIFEEGNYTSAGGEWAELRAYVLAKLLWNPDYDAEKATNEFMAGYYGQAAPAIRKYFDLIHSKVRRENIHMGIFDPPVNPSLTKEIMEKAEEYFVQAEKSAENDEIRQRVQVARLPVMYVQIVTTPELELKPELMEQFLRITEKAGITHVGEWQNRTLARFKELLQKPFLGIAMPQNIPDGIEGALAGRVRPASAADYAGIKPDDIIIEFDQHPIRNWNNLLTIINNYKIGDKIKVKVKRGNEMIELPLTIGRGPLY